MWLCVLESTCTLPSLAAIDPPSPPPGNEECVSVPSFLGGGGGGGGGEEGLATRLHVHLL